ncbi:MAG: hypothetical protein ABSF99_05330 [Anaerolineales bacterium]|jgi:hypothetical protein
MALNQITVNAQMEKLSEIAVTVAKEKFRISLDFSEKSLQQLEILFQKAHEGYKKGSNSGNSQKPLIENIVHVWGSYFGEVIRRNLGGDWIVDQKEVFLQLGSRRLDPLGQIRSRIVDGPQYNVQSFFQGINSRIQDLQQQPSTKPLLEKKKPQISSIDEGTNNHHYYFAANIGILFLVGLCILGILILQGQKKITIPNIGNLPFLFPIQTNTLVYTAPYINQSINSKSTSPSNTAMLTNTVTPTIMPTHTFTDTPTATKTPTPTFTATPTSTLVPMTELARRAKEVLLSRGFVADLNSCGQERSCQAYISQNPFMTVVIMNDGIIRANVWNESHSITNYAQPTGATPPYDSEFVWYCNLIEEIYSNASPHIGVWVASVMGGIMQKGKFSIQDNYLYTIQGVLAANQKINLTITPP